LLLVCAGVEPAKVFAVLAVACIESTWLCCCGAVSEGAICNFILQSATWYVQVLSRGPSTTSSSAAWTAQLQCAALMNPVCCALLHCQPLVCSGVEPRPKYYFLIGSVDSFERKLDDAVLRYSVHAALCCLYLQVLSRGPSTTLSSAAWTVLSASWMMLFCSTQFMLRFAACICRC
jgi:hypothetical protein